MRPLAIALSLALAFVMTAAPQRATEIADSFSKTKYKHKNKRGVNVSLYVEVRAVPVVKPMAAYAGRYEADFGYVLTLNVGADGTLTGNGSDRGAFTLRNARVQDAVLTATKVYANGVTEPLSGAFLTRTVREGTAPDRVRSESSAFGLGVVDLDVDLPGFTHVQRLFYERK
jgi:hypothetical protein